MNLSGSSSVRLSLLPFKYTISVRNRAPQNVRHHQTSILADCSCGGASIARAMAFASAEMQSMRLVLFSRSGLANIRLSLRSIVARQLAFQRSTGCAPWWSLPRATVARIFLLGSDRLM